MMLGLTRDEFEDHIGEVRDLWDQVDNEEITHDQYLIESAKSAAEAQEKHGGIQPFINTATGGALAAAQAALWQYSSEFQKRNDPGYVGDWGDVASRDLAGNIQGISEVYGQPYRDIVDRTKAWFQPSTESGVIDTSVPLTDMMNNRGVVQDDFRASYDAQHPELFTTPVSQALQGIFPEGAPTSLMEEAQPPRSLPIGTPGWQPDIPAQTLVDPALEQALTYQYNPAEFGLDPFTREQVGASSNFLANLMAEGTEAQKTAIQRAISPATSGILRENLAAHFARDDAESPFMVDPSTGETYEFASRAPVDMATILRASVPEPVISREQEIENMMIEDRAAQLRFHPASPLYEAPFEEGTGPEAVREAQPMAVESFADIPETTWTPPAPAVPDITQEIADFSAIRDADEERRNREQDNLERALEKAADNRREAEQRERVATARNKTAEKKRIAKENRERKAEEKRISSSQAKEEKKRRETEKMMTDMLKQMDETRQVYLDRKKKEEDRRRRQGYGVGAMYT
jgi:hypothetical protein